MTSSLPAEVLERVLDAMPVARLALTTTQGLADAMPIVFARVGETLFSPIDGKPKRSTRPARLRHLEANPRVTLVLDHYAHDWSALWWIRVESDATLAEGEHAHWDAAVAALACKYPQYAATPMFVGEPMLVCLERVRVRWWAADGLGGIVRWVDGQAG